MFSKISVLVPTRNRLERLRTLLWSYAQTTRDAEACSELLFKVDEDDPETAAFLRDAGQRFVVGPRLNGYRSLSVFVNALAAEASGDVLMIGNDDMVFRSWNWAPRLLGVANEYPDGLFDLGVTTFNPNVFPFATVSRIVVERLGHLWDPRLSWGDVYLRDVMAAFGRCVMVPDVRIDHDWAGFKPDDVFRAGNQSDPGLWSQQYWEGTHRSVVNEAVTILRPLLDGVAA